MNPTMTYSTHCINRQMMLFGIAPVVILFRWFRTIKTFICRGRRHFAFGNRIIDRIASYATDWFQQISFYVCSLSGSLTFTCLIVFLLTYFPSQLAIGTLTIFVVAIFALRFISIFTITTDAILSYRFNLFALGALLRYDGLRHDCFSYKQLCSEPLASYALVGGLSYYQQQPSYVKEVF